MRQFLPHWHSNCFQCFLYMFIQPRFSEPLSRVEDTGLRAAGIVVSMANVRMSTQVQYKITCDGTGQPKGHLLLPRQLQRCAMANTSTHCTTLSTALSLAGFLSAGPEGFLCAEKFGDVFVLSAEILSFLGKYRAEALAPIDAHPHK